MRNLALWHRVAGENKKFNLELYTVSRGEIEKFLEDNPGFCMNPTDIIITEVREYVVAQGMTYNSGNFEYMNKVQISFIDGGEDNGEIATSEG